MRLLSEERHCHCGQSGGRYLDDQNAILRGGAVPLGFDNGSFVEALKNQPQDGLGSRFTAFVIPKVCGSIRRSS
jgi:hypothetical protein